MAQREHGTRAKYVAERCRCVRCKAANRAYFRNRARQRAYGRRTLVDAAPVCDHIRRLVKSGRTHARIAELAGVPCSTINNLIYRSDGRTRPRTAAAILAVPLAEKNEDRRWVPAIGAARRIQALVAIGHSLSRIAVALDCSRPSLQYDVFTAKRITGARDRAVRALYDLLWDKPPRPTNRYVADAVARAKQRAIDRGWAPPLAWDDGALDDPTATPSTPPHAADIPPVVDSVAIDLVMAGRARFATLTDAEKVAAVRNLAARGATAYGVSKALRCNSDTARRLMNQAMAS